MERLLLCGPACPGQTRSFLSHPNKFRKNLFFSPLIPRSHWLPPVGGLADQEIPPNSPPFPYRLYNAENQLNLHVYWHLEISLSFTIYL